MNPTKLAKLKSLAKAAKERYEEFPDTLMCWECRADHGLILQLIKDYEDAIDMIRDIADLEVEWVASTRSSARKAREFLAKLNGEVK